MTTKTTKQNLHSCGFCSTGARHDLCPGGVLNGNKTEVLVCRCDCDTPKLRCVECYSRENVNASTWTCNDVDACEQRQELKRDTARRGLYGNAVPPTPTTNRRESTHSVPRVPKTGECLCCGEATKGGLFLPGHDSRYLSSAVEDVRGGVRDLASVQASWHDSGVSDALQAKLAKRVAAEGYHTAVDGGVI